jgi:AcrR family transcriptional regulator
MGTRRTQRQEWQRRFIQERAMQVFADHGYHGATMEQVAEAAEVSKGTLYNYFDSKEDLFGSLVERGIDELFAMVDEVVAGGGSLAEITQRLVLHFLEYFESRLGMRLMFLAEGDQTATTHQEIRTLMRSRHRAFIERVADLIRLGQERGVLRPGDPVRAAVVIINILFAEVQLDAMRAQDTPPSEGAEEITAYILGALGVVPETTQPPAGEATPFPQGKTTQLPAGEGIHS